MQRTVEVWFLLFFKVISRSSYILDLYNFEKSSIVIHPRMYFSLYNSSPLNDWFEDINVTKVKHNSVSIIL